MGTYLIAPALVIVLVLGFCVLFRRQYWKTGTQVRAALEALTQRVDAERQSPETDRKDKLAAIFAGSAQEHCWQEYAETLHDQFRVVEGERQRIRSRATAHAAQFFSAQAIVETPLRTEFYKHLPGILTGIGILGTFAGLMLGLNNFDPSTPEQVTASVAELLRDVFFAFLGSGLAIAASIFVTLTEKHLLRQCYDHLEKLNEAIDSLFDGGVGEEYLADLVRSGEESAVQTRLLKDSLVTDLREMLQNLVDTQVRENLKLTEALTSSYQQSGQEIADRVSSSIEQSFKEPLNKIAGAVQSASGDQSQQVQTLLQDILVAFMERLEKTFGQQFNGLHEMLGQSVSAMQSMQQNFASLISDLRTASQASNEAGSKLVTQMLEDMQNSQRVMQGALNATMDHLQQAVAAIGQQGESAGTQMAEQIRRLFDESEARQRAMADGLQAFVDSMRETVGQGQKDTLEKVTTAVAGLGDQLGQLFKSLEQGQQQMGASTQTIQSQLHEGTRQVVGGLEEQVKQLLAAVGDQHTAIQKTLEQLDRQTQSTLNGMQQGADRMRLAAERFETAGGSVSKAAEGNASLLGQIQGASSELVGASRELSSLISDYRANREEVARSLVAIQGIMEAAKVEASGRAQYLQDLKAQAERLQSLNEVAGTYLERVSDVLARGFEDFGAGLDKSLGKTMASLDVEMEKAIRALASGVNDLGENIEELSDTVEKAVAVR